MTLQVSGLSCIAIPKIKWGLPMGREGGVLYEFTKTKEMLLAWIYRGLVAALMAAVGVAISIGAYDLAEMRSDLKAVPLAIQIVSNAQKDTDSTVKVLVQMI